MQAACHKLISPSAMESYPVDRSFARWFLALLLLLSLTPAHCAHAGDWEVIRHEGREYVTLQSLAKFYGFSDKIPPASALIADGPTASVSRSLLLDNSKHQLLVTLGDRLAVIDGVNQYLGFPISAEQDKLIISRLDLAKVIEPSLRPEFIPGLGPVNTIVLDPGHGGHDKGAVCIFGDEKDFALDVCLRARKLLQSKGLNVIMTRTDDTFIPLEQRPVAANRTPHSIFVAIHFNDALANPYASGFEIYSITPQGEPSTADENLSLRDLHAEPGNITDTQSLALSESIYHSMLGNIPQLDRGVKHARFAVIRLAQVPAVLIEGGFVSSSTEARQIATPAYRQQLAEAIVTGITGFKTLAEHHVPPKLLTAYRRDTTPTLPTSPIVQTGAPSVIVNAPSAPASAPQEKEIPQ
jgi:N-acetylmuramoyl-L-alanine amidase